MDHDERRGWGGAQLHFFVWFVSLKKRSQKVPIPKKGAFIKDSIASMQLKATRTVV
jgi:hypothetical protein